MTANVSRTKTALVPCQSRKADTHTHIHTETGTLAFGAAAVEG